MAESDHSVSEELNDVHYILYTKLNLEKEVKTNKNRVEKMEILLRYLKNSNTENSDINEILKATFKQEIIDGLKHGLKNNANLFQTEGGTEFELEFSALMTAIEKQITSIEVAKSDSHHVGKWSAGLEQDAIQTIKEKNEEIQNAIIEGITKQTNSGAIVKFLAPAKRAGKIDVTGVCTLESQIQNDWKPIVELFKNARFTLKNYGDRSDIKLGETAPTRIYFSMLLSLMNNAEKAMHIYYHSYYSYKKNQSKEDIEKHFYHLRFAYELAGYGLTYFTKKVGAKKSFDEQDLGHADFIIYNIPGENGTIYVKSTAQVILDELKNNSRGGVGSDPFEKHITRIKKSYFTGSKKNKT